MQLIPEPSMQSLDSLGLLNFAMAQIPARLLHNTEILCAKLEHKQCLFLETQVKDQQMGQV